MLNKHMTSRERVLTALAHGETDCVAVDLGSTPSSGISAIAYNNFKRHVGIIEGHTRVYDVVQQLAQPEESILGIFGADVLDIGCVFNNEHSSWHDVTLSDGSKAQYPIWFNPVLQQDKNYYAYSNGLIVGRMPQGATFFDQTLFPYIDGYPENYKNLGKDMKKVVWAALTHSPWDHAEDPGFWSILRKKVNNLRENTDKALMIVCGCNLFEWGTFLRRIDNFLMDIYTDQKGVNALLDALLEIHLNTLASVCEAVGDIVDIIRFGDDLGMETGPFMSPEVYRRLFKPRHSILCDYVKNNSNMHCFLHSCGSIYKLLPDIIDAGYNIINPVQTSCKDMDPGKLKKEFGKDISFWGGGVDTRYVLNRGTPQEVREDVLKRLEIFAPDGGFIFNTIHNILPDVPPENIMAMINAIKEFTEGK